MPFIIMLPDRKNIWQLFLLFTLLGVGFYFAASSDNVEAAKYEDGPKAADVETLTQESLEYDYVNLTGLNDSAYIYSYFSEGNDEENVNTEKAVILYYTLHTLKEFDLAIAGEQSRPAVVVRQHVPVEERACVDSEEGCLVGGEITLEGRLSKDVSFPDDKEAVDKLAADFLYTVDDNTLYFDADWRPVTAESAASGKPFAIGWMIISGLLTAFTFYRSRRKKDVTPPLQEQT
jgi:hypothetical protein